MSDTDRLLPRGYGASKASNNGGGSEGVRSDQRMSRQEVRERMDELASLIPEDSLPGTMTFEQLSLAEKKSVLVNRELDDMGMGRYQWCIFTLCGLGYFLDLCWAQAFGLVGASIQQELGIPDDKIAHISTAFNAGLCIGAFAWGLLVDIVGRRWCFNLTCAITTFFGFIFATPSSFPVICMLAGAIGLGIGGNIPIDATITLEFLPTKNRYLLAALSTFQPIGTVVASLLAFALIPTYSCETSLKSCSISEAPCCHRSNNMGWRYTMVLLAFTTLAIFIVRFVVFKFRESPKFLLTKGEDTRALDVIYSIAKFNRREPPVLTLEDFRMFDLEELLRVEGYGARGNGRLSRGNSYAVRVIVGGYQKMFGHLGRLFEEKKYLWIFSSLAIAYMALFWSFAIAGFFLPLILRAKGVDADGSVADTYRSYIYIYLPGVTATLVAAWFMGFGKAGRRWSMVVSAALMGASLALYRFVESREGNIAFNAMEYWFQSFYAALLYAYTPEAFPAQFRGSASGMLSTLGRIASILAPVIGGTVYHGADSPAVLWLGAGGAWLSMVAIASLPLNTKGKQSF
ncbi:hypothetical protein I316_00138 [Kwoniella heveanensis BCC8398]|uniref:Major facilitator superfamily (MFS) profile domain-containing protein n=1 Tax=Kwoniella heveanensis BCC8398 TaxID=1296120 RepID=A0A1B9H3R1_9TREE|nr:hypothetical protein I316_00138 [Kwoniella heveanensis BCC8398]